MATNKKNLSVEITDESYCKTVDIAKLFGVSVRRIQQLTQDGVLHTKSVTINGRNSKRYYLAETVQEYMKHVSAKAEGKGSKGLQDRVQENEARIKDAKATKLEMELQELRGEMHRSEDVEAVTNELVYSIRSMILALPGRLAVDTFSSSSAAEASDLIRQECYQILSELSDHQYDPEKYKSYVREREGWRNDLLPDPEDEDDE